ncbi:MAG TPA: tetratricopeptide repeat protein [Candidatus Krumholzibacteria bacterium]|nr:tetratricopeptide repeat protein [Candidatus Krumholzibacteria bacterium]
MTRRARVARGVVVAAALLALAGCGRGGSLHDIQKAFEKEDYQEVVALSRHALRRGEDRPALHLYNGLGLVGMGRDHEGFDEIATAVAGDDHLAQRAADFLWEQARSQPGSDVSARRMREAVRYAPDLDLGRNRFAVADVCFAERSYADAARLYQQAVAQYPDTAACEEAYARLAECWMELQEPDKARATMETLVEKYPKGRAAGRAAARLDDFSFDQAQAAFDAAEYPRAVDLSLALVESTANRSLQQKARYLLGQSYEAAGDTARAYSAYREIISSDRGDSGRIVERARARIAVLQEAGLH